MERTQAGQVGEDYEEREAKDRLRGAMARDVVYRLRDGLVTCSHPHRPWQSKSLSRSEPLSVAVPTDVTATRLIRFYATVFQFPIPSLLSDPKETYSSCQEP